MARNAVGLLSAALLPPLLLASGACTSAGEAPASSAGGSRDAGIAASGLAVDSAHVYRTDPDRKMVMMAAK
jgi:hypothetical protein